MLEIVHRDNEGIDVVDLKGRLTLGEEDADFRNEMERLPGAGHSGVLLNLSGLSELDATGIGSILFTRRNVEKAGGKLAVFNIRPTHIALLVEASLETSLEVFATEEEAIQTFFPDQNIKPFDILKFVEAAKLKGSSAGTDPPGHPSLRQRA